MVVVAYWLVVGSVTSAVTLHIATLLLLDNPSLGKATAVAGSVWLLALLFAVVHVGGILLGITSLIVGCGALKRLYSVGTGQALIVFFVHAIVEIAIAALLWFMFPSLVGREHRLRHAVSRNRLSGDNRTGMTELREVHDGGGGSDSGWVPHGDAVFERRGGE